MCPSDHLSPNAPPTPTAPKRPVSPPKKVIVKPPVSTPATETPANTGLAFPLADGEDPSQIPSPIPPPSEAMQYRAIGLVRGRYVPDVEQFTKGTMITSDGTMINTVLLGRVMSLLKKHVDLNVDHLWVVYPRTRAENLHMQIVGIWEPETLSKKADPDTAADGAVTDDAPDNSEAARDTAAEAKASVPPGEGPEESASPLGPKVINLVKPAARPPANQPASQKSRRKRPDPIPYHVPEDGFSIRGEVVLQSKEEAYVMVQIKQRARPPKHKGKVFKLRLEGSLGDRAVGHFWDIQVLRKDDKLTILSGTSMGALPPQKRKPGGGKRKPYGKLPQGDRSSGGPRSDAPRHSSPRPAKPRPKVQE